MAAPLQDRDAYGLVPKERVWGPSAGWLTGSCSSISVGDDDLLLCHWAAALMLGQEDGSLWNFTT